MNIFCTNDNPVLAARDLCDKHVRSKMIIESAQMLAHCFSQEVLNHPTTPRSSTGKPRKSGKGYFNHQCSVWCRETLDNCSWLIEHSLEMCRERLYRWPLSQQHFTQTFLEWCSNNLHNSNITKTGLTEFAVAINESSKCRQLPNFNELSVVDKYRAYIIHDKDFALWSVRDKPVWFNNPLEYSYLLFPSCSRQSERLVA
jgi:hypothetical protein